jgi:hypothetical protein
LKIINEDGEQVLERVIFPPLESRLFNKEGIIQVGDSIYKFTYNKTIQTHFSNLKSLSNFAGNKNYFEFEEHQHSIEILKSTMLNCNSPECRIDYDNNYRRLRGEIKRTTSWSTVSLIASSTSLRRPCRGSLCVWYQREADVLHVTASGSYTQRVRIGDFWGWTYPISFNDTKIANKTAQVEWVIASTSYNPGDLQFEYYSVNGTHKLWNDNAYRECNTCY